MFLLFGAKRPFSPSEALAPLCKLLRNMQEVKVIHRRDFIRDFIRDFRGQKNTHNLLIFIQKVIHSVAAIPMKRGCYTDEAWLLYRCHLATSKTSFSSFQYLIIFCSFKASAACFILRRKSLASLFSDPQRLCNVSSFAR